MYNHGIVVEEGSTSYQRPLSTRYGLQVVIGTAPINLVEDPAAVVNRPVMVSSYDEAVKVLGYTDDWNYTLCQSIYASFKKFRVYPVVFINVLDPEKHVEEVAEASHQVLNHQVILPDLGILMDSVKITVAGKEGLTLNQDYMLTFDDAGKVIVTLLSTGQIYDQEEIKAAYKKLAPDLVTEEDIIGHYDIETGKETGLELIRRVYPMFQLPPGLLLAPGWSHKANVGAAMQEKITEINGMFRCECLLDLDTTKAKKYTECGVQKDAAGYTDPHAIVLWPKVKVDGKAMAFSALYGAMTSSLTANNGDVPYLYPSSKPIQAEGAVLEDGTEITLDQTQAAYVNGEGVVTALNDGDWKAFGNNTGAYPEITDPKDRWIGCRRMFSFVANYFVTQFRDRLDSSMNKHAIDDMVNAFNIWGNSLVAQGQCAGLKMEYRKEDNPDDDLLEGRLRVRILLAPYTPMEYIVATEEFDTDTLRRAIIGEEA